MSSSSFSVFSELELELSELELELPELELELPELELELSELELELSELELELSSHVGKGALEDHQDAVNGCSSLNKPNLAKNFCMNPRCVNLSNAFFSLLRVAASL